MFRYFILSLTVLFWTGPILSASADPLDLGEGAADREVSTAEIAARAISTVCQSASNSTDASSMTLRDHVELLGLRRSSRTRDVGWVLPSDARLWEISGSESGVVVFVYGPGRGNCGVIAPSVSQDRVAAELAMADGYSVISDIELEWGVRSVSMFSAQHDSFVDVLDYPASRTGPGLVKIELLSQ